MYSSLYAIMRKIHVSKDKDKREMMQDPCCRRRVVPHIQMNCHEYILFLRYWFMYYHVEKGFLFFTAETVFVCLFE